MTEHTLSSSSWDGPLRLPDRDSQMSLSYATGNHRRLTIPIPCTRTDDHYNLGYMERSTVLRL